MNCLIIYTILISEVLNMQILIYVFFPLVGYLIGSISNSIIISILFFKKDVRDYGSKNAGGTNTGRVFGRKVGIIVIILDIIKAGVVYWGLLLPLRLTSLGNEVNIDLVMSLSMVLVAIGHCYPIYYKFKGGKAVSIVVGFMISTNWLMFVLAALIFFPMLKLKKMVSLGSIITALGLMLLVWLLLIPAVHEISFYGLVSSNLYYYIPTFYALCMLLIFKHRSNITRLINGTENKVKW